MNPLLRRSGTGGSQLNGCFPMYEKIELWLVVSTLDSHVRWSNISSM